MFHRSIASTVGYSALLGAPAPILRAYPPETVVAEQTEAIVSLGIANSRMKDFYDLWMIAQTFAFECGNLAEAIRRTFERRRTPLPEQVPIGLSDSFALERETQWRAVLARHRLEVAPASLVKIINDLRTFLQPVLADTKVASWPPGGPWTEVEWLMIGKLLGHSDIETTARYAHLAQDSIHDTAETDRREHRGRYSVGTPIRSPNTRRLHHRWHSLCLADAPDPRGPAGHRQPARSPSGGDDRALFAFLLGLGQEILQAHRAQHRPGSHVGTVPFRLPGSVRRVSPGLVIVPHAPSSVYGTEEGKEWQASVGPSPSGRVIMSTAPTPGARPAGAAAIQLGQTCAATSEEAAHRAATLAVPAAPAFHFACASAVAARSTRLPLRHPIKPAAQKRSFAFSLRRCRDVHPARFEPTKGSDQCGDHGNAVQDKLKHFRLSVVLRRCHLLDLT